MTGIKYDGNKALPDLVLGDFMIALEQAVFAGTFGAFKYEPKNFQQLEGGEQRYAEAAFRHYMARKKGEEFDSESGELHDAHELWCRIATLYFKLRDDTRVFEKAISRADGKYLGYDLEWHESPTWWEEVPARQAIWRLAGEQKGELDLQVIVREVPTTFEAEVFTADIDPQQLADIVHMIFNKKPEPDYEARDELDPQQGVYVRYFDKWLSGYSGSGISEYHADPGKAVRLHQGCAEKFIAEHPDLPMEIQMDIWFVRSESGDFYQGDGVWTDMQIDANAWTKKEAAVHIEYLNKFSNTKPRIEPA